MKHLLLLLLFPLVLFGQKDTNYRVKGEISELSLSPNNEVWLVSNGGYIYTSKNVSNDLKVILEIPTTKNTFTGESTIEMERVSFFNNEKLFLSGYLGEDLNGKERNKANMIYLSNNHGKSWELVQFTKGYSWIYDVFTKKNGEAWMGGSQGQLYYTNTYGKTWEKSIKPYSSKERSYRILVNDDYIFVASLRGDLSKTDFIKQKTKKIPTPREKGFEVGNDKKINRMALLNSTLILCQGTKVFYTTSYQDIKWVSLQTKITDFSLDTTTKECYGITLENEIVKYNADFSEYKSIATFSKEEVLVDVKANNGELFILTKILKPFEKGDDVVTTFGDMVVTRVGYQKILAYKLYKVTPEGKSIISMQKVD